MYYHGFDRDSVCMVPYMKRHFLETRSGQVIFFSVMIFGMLLSNFLVWEKECIFLKILSIIVFNVMGCGFLFLNWIYFKMFTRDNHDQ